MHKKLLKTLEIKKNRIALFQTMKILYVAAYRLRGEDQLPFRLVQCEDLTSFSIFQRGVVREQLVFATRTFSQRVQQGQRAVLGLDKMPFKLYVLISIFVMY
jgi:hypothetical protein